MNIIYFLISLVLGYAVCLPFMVKNRSKMNGTKFYENAVAENRVLMADLIKCRYVPHTPIRLQRGSRNQYTGSYYITTYEYWVDNNRYRKKLWIKHAPPQLKLFYVKDNPKLAYFSTELVEGKASSRGYKIMKFTPILLTLLFYGIIRLAVLVVELMKSDLHSYF